MTSANPTLLVLGSQDSGKSTYRAQVCQRLEHHEGALQLAKSIANTACLEGDVARLNQGLQPLHTNAKVYHSTALSLKDSRGHEFALEFADYGGEQIKSIGVSNCITETWIERAKKSNAWLFFLQIDQLRPRKHFMTSPVQASTGTAASDAPQSKELENSPEISAVETLQRLLFARETSLRHRLNKPCLGILLSCWDELPEGERAQSTDHVLKQRAPLFYQFLKSNWMSDSLRIWALSSTERRLPENEPDIEFVVTGPENVGFVIGEDGQRNSDLTIPIDWLLQQQHT